MADDRNLPDAADRMLSLDVIALMLRDNIERNSLPVEHSPYKTREALAARNAEHVEIILREFLRYCHTPMRGL